VSCPEIACHKTDKTMKGKQTKGRNELPAKKVNGRLKELNAMTKAVTEIHGGQMSLSEAADLFGVSRYKIERWVAMLTVVREDGSIQMVDNSMKVSVLNAVHHDGMSHEAASAKFGVHKSLIRLWIKLRANPVVGPRFTNQVRKAAPKMDASEKAKVVEQIKQGVLRISQACRIYWVSRTEVKKWIATYTEINLKKTLKDTVYCSMTAEEKNKELEEKLKQAQKLLEEARLKISGLETLIEVAEEKFDIQIKKNIA